MARPLPPRGGAVVPVAIALALLAAAPAVAWVKLVDTRPLVLEAQLLGKLNLDPVVAEDEPSLQLVGARAWLRAQGTWGMAVMQLDGSKNGRPRVLDIFGRWRLLPWLHIDVGRYRVPLTRDHMINYPVMPISDRARLIRLYPTRATGGLLTVAPSFASAELSLQAGVFAIDRDDPLQALASTIPVPSSDALVMGRGTLTWQGLELNGALGFAGYAPDPSEPDRVLPGDTRAWLDASARWSAEGILVGAESLFRVGPAVGLSYGGKLEGELTLLSLGDTELRSMIRFDLLIDGGVLPGGAGGLLLWVGPRFVVRSELRAYAEGGHLDMGPLIQVQGLL